MSDDPASRAPAGTVTCPHCGEAHSTSWSHCPTTGRSLGTGKALVGRIIAGRYRVAGLLAEGGMGTVYVAEHALIGRRVAIKRLHPELARDAATVERFQREARAAAAIGHENIVDVIDMGFAEDGAPYIAMEYLKGETLATALKREGRLAPSRACYILGQVLSALEVVHDHGIVHRDLKPDNIFLTRRNGRSDFVKVLDFGVSKMHAPDGGEASPLTRTGVVVGTPHYISPEQARGSRKHDHRVDLYAAGVMLYECLTGQLPFEGHNYHALLQAILAGTPKPIQSFVPTVPDGLVKVVDRALARLPAERFGTAVEMLAALSSFGAVTSQASDSWGLPSVERSTPTRAVRPSTPTVLAATSTSTSTSTAPPARAPVTATSGSIPRRTHGLASGRSAPHRVRTSSRPPPQAPPPRAPEVFTMSGASAAAGSATRPTGASVLADVSVPLPRGFLPVPRPFDAQSDDWQELPDDTTLAGVRPTPGRTMLTARHTPVASTPVTEEDRHPDVPRVKGALLAVAVDYLRDSYGPSGLDRILGRIRPESAYRLRGVLMPVAWMPAHLLGDLANAAESSVGDGGGDVAIEMGRSAALRSLSTSHRHFTQSVAPTQAILRIPKIWRTFHNGGDVVIIRAPTGAWQVQVSGHVPQTLVHAQVMMGFYLGLLELTGAHDVRADVIAFGELGLGRTVTELHL